MEIKIDTRPASQIDADLLIIGLFQDENVADALKALDSKIPDEFINMAVAESERENFTGKVGSSVQLPGFGAMACKRLLLRGLGKKNEVNQTVLRKAIGAVAKRNSGRNCPHSVAVLPRWQASSPEPAVQAIIEGWLLGAYTFTKYKTTKEDKKPEDRELQVISIAGLGGDEEKLKQAAIRARIIAESTNFARDLIAEPPAFMTPTKLAEEASRLVSDNVVCEVFDSEDAKKMGMGAFLGVARGAGQAPKFIVMRYSHPDATKTIGIAGKGITFDSGGLSIKTAQGMETMKYDMTGAAVAIGTMRAVRALKPKLNVIAVAPATENMPGGNAMHPGDILTAMNGKTIEVNNTDAEGRLILADALSYLTREKPDEIIDVATLTGAVVTTLGRAAAGIMGNDDALIKRISESGSDAGEKYWQLPLYDEYKDSLKSDVADLKNAGSRGEAASCSAGMFLKEFVDSRPWAHLDIAGPAWIEKDKDEINKGGTAFGLRTLCYYLLSQAAN